MNDQTTPLPSEVGAEKPSFFKRNRLFFKIVTIGILTIMLMIPILMVSGLIEERSSTASTAADEVGQKWGGEQNIIGPIISIEMAKFRRINILPDNLEIESKVENETLKRGIYDINLYNATVTLSGNFSLPEDIYGNRALMDSSVITINVGLSDLKGLTEQITMNWGDEKLTLTSGTELFRNGLSTKIAAHSFTAAASRVDFKITIKVNGSNSLMFAPLGINTTATMSSNYPNPSFNGLFLPQSRNVTDNGFTCQWKVLNINRSYPQIYYDNEKEYEIRESTFGVNLIVPVEEYQQSERSIKYAFLIIILTFVVTFFVEVIQKKNIHPIQYLLIGLALSLFYTLLISISEYLGFSLAYLIASLMTVTMITLYMMSIVKIKKTALTMGALLSGLYIYIFVLIQMESYALLAGSIGLFVIVALIMYFSQKIDWLK